MLIATPVYGGRIPSLAAERVKQLAGAGKKAVTLVVYGNRAYEDALRELNDCARAAGFSIVASGAFIAEHSVSRAVAAGRPDAQDRAELAAFGKDILAKLETALENEPAVPGNVPYKEAMRVPATPLFLPSCGQCGKCVRLCPTGAIRREGSELVTEAAKCILCLACVAACPRGSRILPPPMQAAMNERLAPLRSIRRANEQYL